MKGKQLYLFGLKNSPPQTTDKRRPVISLDILTITGVVFALSLIISFSLGVEKGKKIALGQKQTITEPKTQHIDMAETKPAAEPSKKKATSPLEQKTADTEIVSKEEKYNIQVASFQKENTARKAAEQLQEKGYPASIMRKGKYVVIYVGEFYDEGEAKENLQLLREKYKDCILRKARRL